uniref:Fucosyltransferase n=1 Tax=Leersia perrieri TaxID=77586 RepID=A0A0D9XXC4_9ORYZ
MAPMLASAVILFLLLSGYFELPSISSISSPPPPLFATALDTVGSRDGSPFTALLSAFSAWDSAVGCPRIRAKLAGGANATTDAAAITGGAGWSGGAGGGGGRCEEMRTRHVGVMVKGWTWIPDALDGVYTCRCGVSCVWSKSAAVVDLPDALLFEGATPPQQRMKGLPLRVYLDLEASRKPTGFEDIFIGYHAKDDVQVTYAGKSFHTSRSYHVSTEKINDALIYWSSSRCLPHRDKVAEAFLKLVPHHSFGKCLNNVGGPDMALSMYPVCSNDNGKPHWWDHLHCAMSHYKFVLAIENTKTESYVTEKLFYALEAGSVPIYFGAPNVWDFVPPNSIIDASKFSSLRELASYVKTVANDPVAYAEYHAWRRCGILGNFGRSREMSLDTLPCRLCEVVSKRGGRNADAL